MKIIIDIPEEDYKFIKDLKFYNSGRRNGKTIERNVINGIKNGKPLPKGHGRLIDADEIQFERTEFETYGDYCIAFDAIDTATPIIEADKEAENG